MLSPHFSTRLTNQPLNPSKHEALLNSQQNKSTTQNTKHLPTQHQIPTHKRNQNNLLPRHLNPSKHQNTKHLQTQQKHQNTKQNQNNLLPPHLTSYTPPYTFTLANQPFQTRNTQCTSQIPHENPKYISKSKHLPTQHQTPKHKTKSEEPPLPHTSHSIPPSLCFHPISQPA